MRSQCRSRLGERLLGQVLGQTTVTGQGLEHRAPGGGTRHGRSPRTSTGRHRPSTLIIPHTPHRHAGLTPDRHFRLGRATAYTAQTVRASVVPGVHPSRSRLPWMRRTMQTPPGPSGLYDPRFEHDSCGVSFVANIKGVAQPRAGAHRPRRPDQPRPPRRHGRRARHRRRRRDPGPGPRPLPARGARDEHGVELPPAGAYAVGIGFLPGRPAGRREGPGGDRERSSPTRASTSSPGATSRSTRAASAPPRGP